MNPDFTSLPIRDIHLPDPVPWWPPAPGWWVLLLLSVLAIAILAWRLGRRLGSRRLYRAALAELTGLEEEFARTGDGHRLAESISVLLRRTSLSCYPTTEVASLTGAAWLEFLDRVFLEAGEQTGFSGPRGQVLLEAPYNPHLAVDGQALLELARAWIKIVTLRRGTS